MTDFIRTALSFTAGELPFLQQPPSAAENEILSHWVVSGGSVVPDPPHHRKLENRLVSSLASQENILVTSPPSSTLLWKLDSGVLLSQIPHSSRNSEVSG